MYWEVRLLLALFLIGFFFMGLEIAHPGSGLQLLQELRRRHEWFQEKLQKKIQAYHRELEQIRKEAGKRSRR